MYKVIIAGIRKSSEKGFELEIKMSVGNPQMVTELVSVTEIALGAEPGEKKEKFQSQILHKSNCQ